MVTLKKTQEVINYLTQCAIAAYVRTNEKFGFVGTMSEMSVQVLAPTTPQDYPKVFKVNINQVVLIKRPASFPAYTEKQKETNTIRLAQLKHIFETAVEGQKDLSVSLYVENLDNATIHYQISWYKGQR